MRKFLQLFKVVVLKKRDSTIIFLLHVEVSRGFKKNCRVSFPEYQHSK